MTWQDIVLAVGAWVFIVALLPALFSKDKPPVSTSVLTGGILAVYVVVNVTLHLLLNAFSTGILSICWLTLGAQKYFSKTTGQPV